MCKLELEYNIFLLLVIISCLIAIFISFAKKHFFEINSHNYWLAGMIFFLTGSLAFSFGKCTSISLDEYMSMLLFLLAFVFFHFEYQTFNNSKPDLFLFWLPGIVLFFFGIESLLIQFRNASYFIFGLALLKLNAYSTFHLLFRLRNFSFIFKICGILSAILYPMPLILLGLFQKTNHIPSTFTDKQIPLILTIMLCFAQLCMSFNMLLICLGRLYIMQKQRKLEEGKIHKIVSHDLNGAVISINSGIKLMMENNPTNQSLLRSLYNTSIGVQNLLFNVLRWFHKDTDFNKYNTDKIEVKKALESILEFFSLQINGKNLHISFRNTEKAIILINSFVFETIARNLISNAIKFSHHEATIFIDYSTDKSSLFFSVRDFGLGITKHQLKKLNTTGLNTSSPGTDGESGNALGLNIVRDLIQSSSGKIHFDSVKDEGTEVKIQLPIQQTN